MPLRYEIRAVGSRDRDDLLELAGFLDSVNLPNKPRAIEPIIRTSERSFSGEIGDPRRRTYTFVLYDRQEQRAVGTSAIVGQLGRRDAPYVYLDVRTEEKYSTTLDRHFVHTVLEVEYSYNGPTELGGLVMHPDYRRAGDKLGMQISYVRFLFIAMHRELFRDQLLAELLPPLADDGRSHLWEALGKHFTGMTYREADRLSRRNKEFIRGLFPDGDIYASLLPPRAQAVIGAVGRQTRGVEKMLRRIGFQYAQRVDPFDGGPHFVAPTDSVTLVSRSESFTVHVGMPEAPVRGLVAQEFQEAPWFRCVAGMVELRPDSGSAVLEPDLAADLALRDGDTAWILALD